MSTTWTKRPGGTTVWSNRQSNISYSVSWTVITRPTSPFNSQTGYNTDFEGLETYTANGWLILHGYWTTNTRPSTSGLASGSRGFNSDTGMGAEYFDGTNWRSL